MTAKQIFLTPAKKYYSRSRIGMINELRIQEGINKNQAEIIIDDWIETSEIKTTWTHKDDGHFVLSCS